MITKKKYKVTAKNADKYKLYEESVQNVDFEIEFYTSMFKKYSKREGRLLREDFSATAKISQEWVKKNKQNVAYAIDLDKKILDYAKEIARTELTQDQGDRVNYIIANSQTYSMSNVDIISACNFSYWVFKSRVELKKYFTNSYKSLAKDGLLILDAFGGYEAHQELEERTKYKDFTYVWDQHKFNPITNDITCYIHFEFNDKSAIRKAFAYEWRLWSLPEITECLKESGFNNVDIFMQGWDYKKDEETDDFYKTKECDADPGWLAYIIASKR